MVNLSCKFVRIHPWVWPVEHPQSLRLQNPKSWLGLKMHYCKAVYVENPPLKNPLIENPPFFLQVYENPPPFFVQSV